MSPSTPRPLPSLSPGAVVITVAGGLLFGTVAGAALAVAGATVGAVLLFLAARSALGPLLATRAGLLLDRLRPGLERDGFNYLLALRLIPVVPFWLANLAAALVGMRLPPSRRRHCWASSPAPRYSHRSARARPCAGCRRRARPWLVLSAPVLLPLLALAALSLMPALWERWKDRNGCV